MGRVLKSVLYYVEYLSSMTALAAAIIWLVLRFLAGITAPWLITTACVAVIVQLVAPLINAHLRD